jgi:hypothetical protein
MKTQYFQALIYIIISIASFSCVSIQERALIKHISKITTLEEFQKLPDSTQTKLSHNLRIMFRDYRYDNFENPVSGLELESYIPSYLPKGIKNFYRNNLTNFSIKDYYYSYTDTSFCSHIFEFDTCTYSWWKDTSFCYKDKEAFSALYSITWEGRLDTVVYYKDSICNKIDCKVCEYEIYLSEGRLTINIDSMVIYYHYFPVFIWGSMRNNPPPVDCEGTNKYINNGDKSRSYATGTKFFDRKKRRYYNDKLKKDFYVGWMNICSSFLKDEGYEAIMWEDQIWNAKRPRVILYKYDKEKGFSIAKNCHDEYAKYYNDYMEELRKYVENFCAKHNLSKIIFSAYVMVKREN